MDTQTPGTIDIQKIARDFVTTEVYANVGVLVDYILEKSGEDPNAPFSIDDIEFYPDTTDWDADTLHAYIVDELGKTWEDATGEAWEHIIATEEGIAFARNWISRYEDLPAPVEELTVEQISEQVEKMDSWLDVTGEEYSITPSEDEDAYEDEIETARTWVRDNASPAEVFEWWAVSEWLQGRLKEQGEITFDAGALSVWGRQTTGQAIYMDGVIQKIALERGEYTELMAR